MLRREGVESDSERDEIIQGGGVKGRAGGCLSDGSGSCDYLGTDEAAAACISPLSKGAPCNMHQLLRRICTRMGCCHVILGSLIATYICMYVLENSAHLQSSIFTVWTEDYLGRHPQVSRSNRRIPTDCQTAIF